jgi:hypothetical protein
MKFVLLKAATGSGEKGVDIVEPTTTAGQQEKT